MAGSSTVGQIRSVSGGSISTVKKGFSLNGKPLKLRGTNRHQDYAGLGSAVPDALQVKDMELIKDAGFNFVRLAHYPQSPAVLAAADRLGLMIWEEIPIVNYITLSPAFNAKFRADADRDDPPAPQSSLGDNVGIYERDIPASPPKENEENIRQGTVELARRLNKIAYEEDPTRPTTIAFHGSEIYNTTGLGDVADIIGWNLYSGWYSKTFDDFGKFIDDQHARYPKRPLIISEYGANGDRRLHSTEPAPVRFDDRIPADVSRIVSRADQCPALYRGHRDLERVRFRRRAARRNHPAPQSKRDVYLRPQAEGHPLFL